MKSHKQQVIMKLAILLAIILGLTVIYKRGVIFEKFFDTAGQSQAAPVVKNKVDKSLEQRLAALNYHDQQVKVINHNQPNFTDEDLNQKPKFWQKLSYRDWLGRPRVANAMLNQTAMPRTDRKKLTVKTPGYRVYQFTNNINGQQTYLYNRSHLIGYQLTGENNNVRNLITGTVALNANHQTDDQPSMETYENEVAHYLRQSPEHEVRYRVTPIYRNIERVPRGIQMEAESVGRHDLQFNVYIFNAQPGWLINYYTGSAIQN